MNDNIWVLFCTKKQQPTIMKNVWSYKPTFEEFCFYFSDGIKLYDGETIFDALNECCGDFLARLYLIYHGREIMTYDGKFVFKQIESIKD